MGVGCGELAAVGHAEDGRAICAEAPIPWRCIVPGESKARSHKRCLGHVAGRVVSWGATLHGSAAVALNNSCLLLVMDCRLGNVQRRAIVQSSWDLVVKPHSRRGCSLDAPFLPTVHASRIRAESVNRTR